MERPAKRYYVGLVAVGVQEQAVYDDDDDTWVPLSQLACPVALTLSGWLSLIAQFSEVGYVLISSSNIRSQTHNTSCFIHYFFVLDVQIVFASCNTRINLPAGL